MSDSLVIGGPGVLAAWVHALVREAATLARNAPEIRMLDRQDDAEFLGAGDASADRIFLCNFPSSSLVAKVEAGAVPTLALLDEPIDAVRYVKHQSNWSFEDVLRACALAHTVDRALYENASVLIIHRGMELEAPEAIGLILQCLGLELDAEALKGLEERHAGQGRGLRLEELLSKNVEEWMPLEEAPKHMTEDEAAIVSQVLAPTVHYAFDAKPPKIVWSQKLFFFGDKPNEKAPIVSELIGGARTIVYGPYLYLPPGRYRVSFVLGFSDDTKGMPFVMKAVQMFGQSTVAEARCIAPGGGIYEGSFEMAHVRSNEAIEMILRNDEGAIEGRVALVQVGFDLLQAEETAVALADERSPDFD